MTNEKPPRVVLTGGPGSGKTSLLRELRARGLATVPESGRGVIRDQLEVDGPGLPWRNRALFAELMLGADLRAYRHSSRYTPSVPVFFDRGVVDVLAYLRLERLPVPEHTRRAATELRYHRRVLLAPSWPAIYRRDAERRQDHDEAVRTGEACVAAYEEYGYELLTLPFAPVSERADFALAALDFPSA